MCQILFILTQDEDKQLNALKNNLSAWSCYQSSQNVDRLVWSCSPFTKSNNVENARKYRVIIGRCL